MRTWYKAAQEGPAGDDWLSNFPKGPYRDFANPNTHEPQPPPAPTRWNDARTMAVETANAIIDLAVRLDGYAELKDFLDAGFTASSIRLMFDLGYLARSERPRPPGRISPAQRPRPDSMTAFSDQDVMTLTGRRPKSGLLDTATAKEETYPPNQTGMRPLGP